MLFRWYKKNIFLFFYCSYSLYNSTIVKSCERNTYKKEEKIGVGFVVLWCISSSFSDSKIPHLIISVQVLTYLIANEFYFNIRVSGLIFLYRLLVDKILSTYCYYFYSVWNFIIDTALHILLQVCTVSKCDSMSTLHIRESVLYATCNQMWCIFGGSIGSFQNLCFCFCVFVCVICWLNSCYRFLIILLPWRTLWKFGEKKKAKRKKDNLKYGRFGENSAPH